MLVVFIWLLCVERCVQPKALKKMIAEEMNHIEINNITYIKRSALPLEHSFRCHCHWIWRDNLTIDTTAIETNPQIQRAWNRVKYSSQSNVIQCILQKALPCLRSGSPFFLQPERCVCVLMTWTKNHRWKTFNYWIRCEKWTNLPKWLNKMKKKKKW